MTVDLRSDTVTRPTPAMRDAMAGAEVGDDVYGEDPTVTALEQEVAGLLGHEAGLFTPSGSLANMLGVRVLVDPGQELLCDAAAHVVRAELGGHAVLGQVTTRTWISPAGLLDDAAVDAALSLAAPDAGPYLVSTAAFAVENTHNFGGGTVQPLPTMQRLKREAGALGLAVHLDGARLANAAVATGTSLAEYGACADSVSLCLSKGLGAPVGSVLVGSAERIGRARVLRKRYGGGMRQAGILAEAGRYALAHHFARLAEDHTRATALAGALAGVAPGICPPQVPTNIVVLDLRERAVDAPTLTAKAAEQGVRLSALGPRTARLVTHLDVDDAGIDQAIEVLTALV